MPCDYPSLTCPIRDRKSMNPVRALTGHHGPRATYKQIVRTFEIRWGRHDCLRSVCLRLFPNPHSIITDPYGIRTCPYGSRLCTVRNPWGSCDPVTKNTQKTHRAPVCMWPCTSHEVDFVHVRTSQVPQTRTAPQILRSRDHPYVSGDLSILFVINNLCARIVTVTASSATAAVRVRFQL